MSLKLLTRKFTRSIAPAEEPRRLPGQPDTFEPAEPRTYAADELTRALEMERFGIVAAPPHWTGHPQYEAGRQQAAAALDERFAVVPEGYAALPQTIHDAPGCPETDVETRPFLLARHAVTQAQYQSFLAGGGYSQLDLWPEDIWPHLIDFKDLTGEPGPRYWRNGQYDRRLADHPVVGVCYYEAAAYAAWAGYRLPTESEWQMAASWRIRSSAHVLRRYPWGDALDKRRCNIWASGVGHTTAVSDYESGAAPNGVLQLVGNVWEWTSSDFEVGDDQGRPVVGDMLMKSIRGGAFDTYFPAQATSTFRTGLASLVRAHNVGFRCAMEVQG
jgi:gamma-glutamyl hercynylcysteine S-oxide synthase